MDSPLGSSPVLVFARSGTRTLPAAYNKAAAELAWKRTIAFFKEKLRT
jgi:dienelactone hydrolase